MKSLIKIIAVLACLAAAVPSLQAQTDESRDAVIAQLTANGADLDNLTAEEVAEAVKQLSEEDPDSAADYAASGIQLLPIDVQEAEAPEIAAAAVAGVRASGATTTTITTISTQIRTKTTAVAPGASSQIQTAVSAAVRAGTSGEGPGEDIDLPDPDTETASESTTD